MPIESLNTMTYRTFMAPSWGPPRPRAFPRSAILVRTCFPVRGGALAEAADNAHARSLPHRLLIDPFLLEEHDRDQNVYLGRFYTRVLTQAVPDVIFQPVDGFEVATALGWARRTRLPVTVRGAGS